MDDAESPSSQRARAGRQRPEWNPEEQDDSMALAQFHTLETRPAVLVRGPNVSHLIAPKESRLPTIPG
jgi:hypothetical protein